MNGAAGALEPRADGVPRLGVRRAGRTAEFREKSIDGAVLAFRLRCHEPVPRRKEIRLRLRQRFALVAEHLQCQNGRPTPGRSIAGA